MTPDRSAEPSRQVDSAHSTVTWSNGGSLVVKRYLAPDRFTIFDRSRLGYEARVNRWLLRHPPPVRFPRLVGVDRAAGTLSFEAIDGDPVGLKFPTELDSATLDKMINLAWAIPARVTGCRWLRRFSLGARLRSAVAVGHLREGDAGAVLRAAPIGPPSLRFAHGDLTARNVLRSSMGELVVIDWEWAGLYPVGYEAAFLWLSVLDVPGARARVEASVPEGAAAWFWRSALCVQLVHLALYAPRPELAGLLERHLATRDELVERITSSPMAG
ncbi:MAG: phosphotransferase [Acidimicrobiales bacterium]